MNTYSVVQFSTLIVYLILMVVVLRYAKTRLKNLFLVFLAASSAWSLTSVLAHADFTQGNTAPLFLRLVPLCSMWVIVAYSHFIASFVNRGARKIFILGYGFLFIIAALIALGYIPQEIIALGDSNIQAVYGPWMLLMSLGGASLIGTSVFLLVKSYRASRNAEHRNRITYLLVGIGLLTVFGILYNILPPQEFAPDQIGHLGNAIVVTFAILK